MAIWSNDLNVWVSTYDMGLKEVAKESKYERGCVYVMGGRVKGKRVLAR